jgi:hypothetical protein
VAVLPLAAAAVLMQLDKQRQMETKLVQVVQVLLLQ